MISSSQVQGFGRGMPLAGNTTNQFSHDTRPKAYDRVMIGWGESKLSYSIDKRAAETVIYCYLQTTSRQLPDFQAAPKPAYLPLSTEVPYQNSGTP